MEENGGGRREGEERGVRTEGGVWGDMINVGFSWRDDQRLHTGAVSRMKWPPSSLHCPGP